MLLIEPAVKPGLKGGTPAGGQGPPPGPLLTVKVEVDSIGALPDQGVRIALVV